MLDLEKEKINRIINWIGLSVLGIFCLGYSIFSIEFSPSFAELNIQFPFFNFPIFIGEILLGFCIVLLLVKYRISPIRLNCWHYLLFVYIGFILSKAFYGYFRWGPLAFRNAAMFYYFLFVVICYYLFEVSLLNKKIVYLIALSILNAAILFRLPGGNYFQYEYIILAFILFLKIDNKLLRYAAILFLFVIIPYKLFFESSLAMIVSEMAVLLFLSFILLSILKKQLVYKMVFSLFLLVILGLFLYSYGNKNAVESLMSPGSILKSYRENIKLINGKKDNFRPKDKTPIKLYEKNPVVRAEQLPPRDIEKEYLTRFDNISWRLLVWKDMFEDLFGSIKNVFGLDFGRPFRSRSAELVGWSGGEDVGWLEPHNSYIHILYRAGIVGFLFIIIVWGIFIKMVKLFLRNHNLAGILLCSALLLRLIHANFTVVLELPYFAIPFWSLFGVTCGYYNKKVKGL